MAKLARVLSILLATYSIQGFNQGGIFSQAYGSGAAVGSVQNLQGGTATAKKPWRPGDLWSLPPFAEVKIKDFRPALEKAMAQRRQEIAAIVNNPAPANFLNTIEALEKSGKAYSQWEVLFSVWTANLSSPEIVKLEEEFAPITAAFDGEVSQNTQLFAKIEHVYSTMKKTNLTPEQQRLVWLYYTGFLKQGARLTANQKQEVNRINQELASLYAKFSQNQLSDESNDGLVVDTETELDGLPYRMKDNAKLEASNRGLAGKWFFPNTRSSMDPFLTYASNRALREKAFRIWASRGDNGNATDNNGIIPKILSLRKERSKIFGYATFADWKLTDKMAKDPKRAMDLMLHLWTPAVQQANQEIADLQKIADEEGNSFKIEAWDHRYYTEKVRKAKYDLDLDEVKPFLRIGNIQNAMFLVAHKLFGFRFAATRGIQTFHPDVTVYRVYDRNNNDIGLWYFDPFARPNKRSGAWMMAYRNQTNFDGQYQSTLVSNNSNFIKPKPGEAALLSWDDAITMLHEFGHALHGLSSRVTYPSVSGTSTATDFVEFPSQFLENYMFTPAVLSQLKNEKGEQLPQTLIDKIISAKRFNQGFSTVEFLASAIVDMKLHLLEDTNIDPKTFEAQTLASLGMPSAIIMRHRMPHFAHIFSGDGYAAGYYSYLWSQTLEADTYEAFLEKNDPFDPQTAKSLSENIFSVGNSIDPLAAFQKFRGRAPKVDALLRKKGFIP